MATSALRLWATEEWSFAILRAMAMLGGMVALFLVPIRPEHQAHVIPLAWVFVAYKVCLFLALRAWPGHVRTLLAGSVGADLLFVSLFVWFSGGVQSHFYLLFYLLVALAAVHFSPGMALGTAGGAGVVYTLASVVGAPSTDWPHLSARVATFFLLGGSLGYLSQRERLARAEAERLSREVQAAQERLVQSERLAVIGQMSAKVSHEVRNPLSSISLNTELLEDELEALPTHRRGEAAALLGAIRSQVDVLSAVTEEYLRFARLPTPRPEPVAVGPLVEDLAAFVRGELRGRGVELAVETPDDQPLLRLDPGQIRQALLNLIRNGAEAMPDGGTITLRVRAEAKGRGGAEEKGSKKAGEQGSRGAGEKGGRGEGRNVIIEVRDIGAGIPPEHRERIFEPFFTTKEGGTGLGLAIARQIAADHGGSLTCESSPGGGTAFRLSLPVPGDEVEA